MNLIYQEDLTMNIKRNTVNRTVWRLSSMLITVVICIFSAGNAAHAVDADTELVNKAKAILGPLPSSMPSPDNPITPEKVKLGNVLFWESRISVDRTISCAKCHPLSLYAVDGLRKSLGNNCKENPRNDPTIFNAASQISEHWIGNRTSVEDQAKQALIGPPSFGMPNYESVEKILKGMKGYVAMFKEAFPNEKDPVTVDNFAKAVGAFERTLVTPGPFDDFMQGNAAALTEQQKRGLTTFMDTGCITCHFGPYVGGQMYQKIGVFEPYAKYTKSQTIDEGRFAVTKNPSDKFVFKVPVLRNVAATPPYFHDGSVDKLTEAVVIMAKIQLAKDLTKEQAADIVAFLSSMTGKIPEEALRVPILPAEEQLK
jgi:cytochrome c peroxidase